MYFGGWLANSQIDTPVPIAIATGPAQLVYFWLKSNCSFCWQRAS